MESRWPAEANFSNMNAYAVMDALGVPSEPCGSMLHADLPNLLQRALVVLNDDRAAVQHTRPAWSSESGQAGVEVREDGNLIQIVRLGPAMWVAGMDKDGLRARVQSVVAVIEAAHELGVGICWG
jgi:hypothetical protein